MTNDNSNHFETKTYHKDKTLLSDYRGYYRILGLDVGASNEDIKLAYRKKAKELHPDYNKAPDAELNFGRLKNANDILNDNLLRNIYNIKSIGKYVENANHKFSLDFKVCSFCGCVPSQPRVIKHLKAENLFCFKCAEKFKNWHIVKEKSLQVLLEQMLAFITSGQLEKAVITAKQALILTTDDFEKEALKNIISELTPDDEIFYQNEWREPFKFNFNFKMNKKYLFVLAMILLFFKIIYLMRETIKEVYLPSLSRTKPKQDNIIGQNVLSIPVDIKDEKMIYHLKNNAKVFHGPASEYDLLRTLERGTTVRLTGVVLDSSFVRIMMSDGVIGFIDNDYLKKGFGKKDIPIDNVIFDTTPIVSEGK